MAQGIRHVWRDPSLNNGQGDFRNDQWSGPNVDPSNRPIQAAAGDPAFMVTNHVQHMFYRDSRAINWFKNVVVSSTNSPGWGRMLLSDQEGDNLITYTDDGGTRQSTIKVAKSNDMATWTGQVLIGAMT